MSAQYLLSGLVGLTMFSFYVHCDPLVNGRADRVEELAAAFASDIGQTVPGLVGLFATGIFSGSLSSLSSNLNSLSTQFFEDILKRYFRQNTQEPLPYEQVLVRASAVIIGLCTVGTVWIAR
jgi:sodium-coupled monocarboxylate transporter 8/12